MQGSKIQWINRGITLCIALLLVAPIAIAVIMSFTASDSLRFPPKGFSFQWYEAVVNEPKWQERVPVSLEVAVVSSLLATALSTLAAFSLVRSNIRGKGLISALFIAPLIVPIVVLGSGDFFVWARGWSLGPFSFGGRLVGTVSGLVMAHTVIAIPYPFITVRTSLNNVDPLLELAARNLGAHPLKAFRTITLPLIMPGVLSGLIFAFIASWDEVVIASFLSTSRVSTVPVQIFNQLRDSLDPSAAALSTLLLAASACLIGLLALVRKNQNPAGKIEKGERAS
ncbi:ABC transporter permease [Desulfospira joergensenii]|uniref:ABC transporter permease n=1 Tax=Desulfospira joergensenii TaxID=53329 RepID=UPI0003B4B827|nr:ABC transporter permease [Desulfospira joergensenii]